MVFAPFTGVDNHKKCVTFAAGLLLKEDVESYVWIFRQFLDAMGREPICVITDQDPSMKIAFTKVFTTSAHRFCMWHIMSKVSSKVGPVLSKNSEFMSKLNYVVWSHYLEPDVFEKKWTSIMEEFGLQNHVWFSNMYDIRKDWIPSYFRDLYMAGLLRTTSRSESENNFFGEFSNPHFSLVEFYMQFESAMDAQRHSNAKLNADCESYFPTYKTPLAIERYAATVYTLTIFSDVQSEICSACFSCRVTSLRENEDCLEYLISDERGLRFTVHCKSDATNLTCSCKYFLRLGLVCRHMFVVLKDFKSECIPADLLNTRWFKKGCIKPLFDIGDAVVQQSAALEEKKFVVNQLWCDIHSCVAMVENDPSLLRQFASLITQNKEIIASTMQDAQSLTNKTSVIQPFFGSSAPTSVNVLQPPQAHNKGSGKRIKGAKELVVAQSQRAKRLCRSCNEMSYHDSRNCPKNSAL
ncbi:unnamed protein product [Cuscuta europaea]|uniref:SWIM-type domain-containing protein n=2 Tax=Cuscuta europaea TaxID=41803 RepID=A0A9P0YJZ9_CUSEU|nr:unnamed protein product [Cuscuta europaea]